MENNYYLKDGLLYKISGGTTYRVSIDDVASDNNKSGLLIDDSYFFYVGMEHVATSAKKLKSIASNYLNILFPADIVSAYGVFQNSSKTVIYVINNSLLDIISNNSDVFSGFKKISTPFLELCIKYNEFIFFDGIKKYKLENNFVSITNENDVEYITSQDLFDTMDSVKYSMMLPGIIKKSALQLPIVAPAVLLFIVYITFIIGSISDISAYKKVNAYYEDALLKVYDNLGVSSSKDPYGSLLQQAKAVTGGSNSQRIISIFNDLNDASVEGVSFEGINIRDNDIRVTGTASNFAQVEEIKRIMENKLQNSVNIDDTKKNKDGITFTMKYQKDNK